MCALVHVSKCAYHVFTLASLDIRHIFELDEFHM